MNELDVAYAAGLIDGEGSVSLTRNHSSENRSPQVSVASTTYHLVEWLRSNFEGTISRKALVSGFKQAYVWTLKYDSAIEFLEKVLPYLREPEKERRGRLLVDEYKLVTSRNGKYSDEMKLARENFERRFFAHAVVAQR